MAEYFEHEWNGYAIKLCPNDWLRRRINAMPLFDFIPYFSASYIYFDLSLFLHRKEDNKWYSGIANMFPEIRRKEQNKFNYEWQLCDENNVAIAVGNKNSLRFYNTEGKGEFEFSTRTERIKELKEQGYRCYKDRYGHFARKARAIDIGRLNKYIHYNVLMRFVDQNNIASDWKLMAGFKLYDKEDVRMTGCFPGLISILVTLATVFILKGCALD